MPGEVLLNLICKLYHIRNPAFQFRKAFPYHTYLKGEYAMSLLHSEYRDRLAHWQRVLASDFYRPLESIQFDGLPPCGILRPGQAAQGPFCPMEEGTAWGHTWEYMWCRADITLPEVAADKTVAMELDLGGEATLFVNGKAFGTRRAEWVSVPHHYICDNILTHCAQPGERFSLLFEVYAGHYFPDVGGCSTGPVLPGTLQDPAAEGCRSPDGTQYLWHLERKCLPALDGCFHSVHADG